MLNDGFLVESGILKPSSARELSKGLYPAGAGAPLSFKALTLELWSRKLADMASQAQQSGPCTHLKRGQAA